MARCFHCGGIIEAGYKPGRGESCRRCGSDLKVCLNCRFYDKASYNECREPAAERVVDKEKANFCEHFELGEGRAADSNEDPLKALKDLFRK